MSDPNNQRLQEARRVLSDDHLQVDKLIKELLAALSQENKTKSFELLDLLWARLAVHIRAEHLCLFPSILGAPAESFTGSGGTPQYDEAQSTIELLRHDHDFFMRELGMAVNNFREQAAGSDQDVISKQLQDVRRCVVQVQSRLAQHNQLEEDYVYEWVNILFGETERLAITARIRRELENFPSRIRSDGL